jgi:adenylate cyclase class 2
VDIEYEATFESVNKPQLRLKLASTGAKLLKSEFLQKRTVFKLPKSVEVSGGWARVRDEGDKITVSVKAVTGTKITDQKEVCIVVDSYHRAEQFLQVSGFMKKAYQETFRELWILNGVEVTIDTWPFLDPFVEIEGTSESVVQEVSELLGFDWETARFCAVDQLYEEKYGVSKNKINNETPKIVFDMVNPFL